MRRGEIWTVAGGTFASKPRPGIIIQDDSAHGSSSVTIIPLTSMPSELRRVRVAIQLEAPDGTSIESFAQVDKITTVKTQGVSKRIGALTIPEMRAVERSLLGHLGIGSIR